MGRRRQKPTQSIYDDIDLDTATLIADFPWLTDPQRRAKLVAVICETAEISEVHCINTNGIVEAKIVADRAFQELLPRLYRRAYIRGDYPITDTESALRDAVNALIDILRMLPTQVENRIYHALEEVWNCVRWKGRLPSQVRASLDKEHGLPPEKRGRRISRRMLAIEAAKMKEQNPKLSWMQIAQKLCRCGKGQHDSRCRDNLRQGVIALKKESKLHRGVF